MIKHRLPWLEVWGPGGKLETAGRFCPPNLSALWETQPRNQPAPHHGAGKRHRQGHGVAEMAESSERHSSVCEKERKRSFQSSAGWNPLALLPLGAPGGAECTYTHRSVCSDHVCVPTLARTHSCTRVPSPHTHTHAPTSTCARAHRNVRATTCPHAFTHTHTRTRAPTPRAHERSLVVASGPARAVGSD